MRGKKAMLSTLVSFVFQIVSIISALIIPRIIIEKFGSDVNGLIQSITQFLGYISLLQLGIGGIIRAKLYKPLATKDNEEVSMIFKSTSQYFRKLFIITIFYVIILSIGFSIVFSKNFSFNYIFMLVIIIGIGMVTQYMLGMPYRLLIMADQKNYIYDLVQILSIVLNTVFTIILANQNCNIIIIKASSCLIFIIQPVLLYLYVRKNYKINRREKGNLTILKDRTYGILYSLADFIHRKTDIFLLTIFSSLSEVSVYSVYSLIVNGINSIVSMLTNPFQSAFGDMIAKNENKSLNENMNVYIFLIHFSCSVLFSVTILVIIPFISLYVGRIDESSYIRPLFSVLIIVAELFYCLRMPYQNVIVAAGKFKETQKGAFFEAIINIIISIGLINKFGLVGVALGTLVAMIYRTIDLIIYLHNNLLCLSLKKELKRYIITVSTIIIIVLILQTFKISIYNYRDWIVYSTIVTLFAICFSLVPTILFYKNELMIFMKKIMNILKRKVKIKNE